MSDIWREPLDATLLDPDERAGLIPTTIGTRHELNDAEETNIARATAWARNRKDVLSDAFAQELHRRMFGQVWTWAGTYRRTNKNIGIDAREIPIALHSALGDIRFAIEHQSMVPLEIAVRLHHRLVFIHPFMNGNGRHARLMADLIAKQLGLRPLTWGSADLGSPSAVRKRYIAALKAADNHDIAPLIAFAHS
jgi:Fic-DOC domain mobile mystery protein B